MNPESHANVCGEKGETNGCRRLLREECSLGEWIRMPKWQERMHVMTLNKGHVKVETLPESDAGNRSINGSPVIFS